MKTLPVGISESFLGEFGFDYAGIMTISVVASLPVLLLSDLPEIYGRWPDRWCR